MSFIADRSLCGGDVDCGGYAARGAAFWRRSSHELTKRRIPLLVLRFVGLAMSHCRIAASCWRTLTAG